ncbi:type I methionyl aminopeptidase [Caldilinea sp.]|uniref:type I methionyl aminopeptidase n=1 Tax=Caldilinea sp. TaxID=2293560 RepID=UPI00260F76C9|nr:type I methionyl aminopeptidase [Caldilinea sp.]
MFRRQQQARTVRRPASSAQRPQPQLKSPREIQIMREAGRIVARVHAVLREAIRPGVSTWELDQLAAETMSKYNAASCFLGYRGFPAHICTSINEELVHGIPSKDRILKAGDIISIDVGVRYRGFIGDSAWTYAVGEISPEARALMRVTEESLYQGIAQAHPGRRVVDISRAVQRHVEAHGFHVVREYTGHGVGRQMHEAPQVLNYESQDPDGQIVLQPGLVIAIEPMVQIGTWQTRTLKDNWTVISKDHSLTAHFEHTVAITNNGPEILTLP